MSRPEITLEYYDWGEILTAVEHEIRSIRESCLLRTGMGSQTLPGRLERLERAREVVKSEMHRQDYEQWLEANPEVAKEIRGIHCSLEGCSGPISKNGCTRIGCPIRMRQKARFFTNGQGHRVARCHICRYEKLSHEVYPTPAGPRCRDTAECKRRAG